MNNIIKLNAQAQRANEMEAQKAQILLERRRNEDHAKMEKERTWFSQQKRIGGVVLHLLLRVNVDA